MQMISTFLASVLMFSGHGLMAADAGPDYHVRLVIVDGGRVIGQPTIALKAGHPASMAVVNVYEVSVLVKESADPEHPLILETNVKLPVAGRMVRVADPSFAIKPDQRVSAELSTAATARSLRVEAIVSKQS